MKLYYSPAACSLATHITLRELGLPFEAVKVDLAGKTTGDGRDFRRINPKGYVPTLVLDDGSTLTEGPVIMQYLADRDPESRLAPASGMPRYRLQEMLGFINSEVHKTYSPLFSAETCEAAKVVAREKLAPKFDYLEARIAGNDYLFGDAFTIADAYLYTVLNWAGFAGIDLARWPQLKAYHARVGLRPAVKAAHVAER